MHGTLRGVFLLLFLGSAMWCAAQERLRPESRQELWTSVGLQGGAPKPICGLFEDSFCDRLRFGAELGYRSADVFFAGRQVYLDLKGSYKLNGPLSVGFEHRFAARGQQPLEQRTIVELRFKEKIDRLNFSYRFNYQHSYIEWGDQREVLRNRFDLGYDIKKWKLDPEVGVEFFTWLGNKGVSYFGTRYHIGTEWSPAKGHTIGLQLLHDRERDVAWPRYRWIWSVSYEVNLRKT